MDIYNLHELGFRLPQLSGVIRATKANEFAEAHDIVAIAKAKAAQIMEDAEAQFEIERQRGFEEGHNKANISAIERLLLEEETLESSLAEIEQSLVRLVLASVRKIIHDFSDVALAEALIHSGLGKIRREKRVQLRVPDALTDEMKSRIDSFVAAFPQIEFIEVVEDPVLMPPNIVIETSFGRIDCNIDDKLNELIASLAQVATDRSNAAQLPAGAEIE